MKCTNCHAAEPGTKYRGEVPYWYKGHATSIHGVNQYVCLRCGNESIPPGHVQRWLEQTALFRAEIDARKPNQAPRPESLMDKIMIEWLSLDPDRLADEVQVEQGAYIRWETLANYAKQHRNKVFEAFAGYKGSHTADRPGCAYLPDWMEFIEALRKARAIAADPRWEPPRDGVVYHGKERAM
jgi:hypothetical protein